MLDNYVKQEENASIPREVSIALLPPFGIDGLLPPGDHALSFVELRKSQLVDGHADEELNPLWDAQWRATLVDNLEILVRQLWQTGVQEIFVDGSFVEDKLHPNDIDGYFGCTLDSLSSGRLTRELNRIDPYKVWTWDPASRRPYRGYSKKQLPMWHRYRVELYPHVGGLGSGIRDQHGHELEFPAAFRRSRTDGKPRGVVKIQYGGD